MTEREIEMSDLRSKAARAVAGEDTSAINDGVDPYGETPPGPDPQWATTGDGHDRHAVAQVPDLADSGIEASMNVPAAVAWSRVMGEVQFVKKSGRRDDFGGHYDFRGIDAVLNAVGPALRKHGVTVAQTKVVPEYDIVMTGNNKAMQRCKVTVTYGIVGPQGDVYPLPLESIGEAFDAGDKSTPKAVSVALRSFYINNLAIPTAQPEMDPERGKQYEIATPKPPTAEEYRDEILRETTSLQRLRAIRGELEKLPAISSILVSDIDGVEMTLAQLILKIGRERAQQA